MEEAHSNAGLSAQRQNRSMSARPIPSPQARPRDLFKECGPLPSPSSSGRSPPGSPKWGFQLHRNVSRERQPSSPTNAKREANFALQAFGMTPGVDATIKRRSAENSLERRPSSRSVTPDTAAHIRQALSSTNAKFEANSAQLALGMFGSNIEANIKRRQVERSPSVSKTESLRTLQSFGVAPEIDANIKRRHSCDRVETSRESRSSAPSKFEDAFMLMMNIDANIWRGKHCHQTGSGPSSQHGRASVGSSSPSDLIEYLLGGDGAKVKNKFKATASPSKRQDRSAEFSSDLLCKNSLSRQGSPHRGRYMPVLLSKRHDSSHILSETPVSSLPGTAVPQHNCHTPVHEKVTRKRRESSQRRSPTPAQSRSKRQESPQQGSCTPISLFSAQDRQHNVSASPSSPKRQVRSQNLFQTPTPSPSNPCSSPSGSSHRATLTPKRSVLSTGSVTPTTFLEEGVTTCGLPSEASFSSESQWREIPVFQPQVCSERADAHASAKVSSSASATVGADVILAVAPPLKLVFFDFDCTLTVAHVGAALEGEQHTPSPLRISAPYARTECGQLARLAELDRDPAWGPGAFALAAFGGAERIKDLKGLLSGLQLMGVESVVCSKGLVGPMRKCLQQAGLLPFFKQTFGYSRSLQDMTDYDLQQGSLLEYTPGDVFGTSEMRKGTAKADTIRQCLSHRGLNCAQAILVDHNIEEIRSVFSICMTIHVRTADGMGKTEFQMLHRMLSFSSPPRPLALPPSLARSRFSSMVQ